MTTQGRTAREVVVHGRVQGVYFRDSARDKALGADVHGWVSNEDDGTVRAHFEGSAGAVDQMVAWARRGPSRARVDHVEVTEVPAEGGSGFEVR